MSDGPFVRVGQVWRSTDPRDIGVPFVIECIAGEYAYTRGLVYGQALGRRSRVKVSRLRPESHGYELLEEAHDGDDS